MGADGSIVKDVQLTTRRIDSSELTGLSLLSIFALVFGIYGFATRSPNTVLYLFTVAAVTALLIRLRSTSLPKPLTFALPCVALAHLAGGLVRVGDDVLYNAHIGSRVFQYDHLVHSVAVFVGTLVIWSVLVPRSLHPSRRGGAIAVSVLAGLGLGAANETVEFLSTLVQHGNHVGGYENTGWDLVCNVAGATAAGLWIDRSTR